MKPLQIAALVIAGALGGAIVMKTVQRPAPEVAQAPARPQTAAVPHETERPAEPPAPIRIPSVATPAAQAPQAESKPSPVVEPPRPVAARKQSQPQPLRRVAVRSAEPPDKPVVVKVPTPPAAAIPVPPSQPEPRTVPEPRPAPPAAPPAEAAPPVRAESENATPQPPPRPAPRQVTLNAGMLIPVRLVDGLSSERNSPGDTFNGTLTKELVADGLVIAERGARVEGRVVSSDRGGKVRGVSSMAIELTRIHTSDGQTVRIETDPFERHAEPSHTTDAAKVGGGAAVGAIIGAIAGGGKGAAIGAGVGGAAGAGDVMMTRGRPAALPSETRLSFRLRTPVTLTEHTSRD